MIVIDGLLQLSKNVEMCEGVPLGTPFLYGIPLVYLDFGSCWTEEA